MSFRIALRRRLAALACLTGIALAEPRPGRR